MASIGQIIFWSMIVLIFVIAGLIILLLAIAFSVSQGSVVTNSPFTVGNLGQDVILDCSFQTTTGQIPSDVSITWTKDGLTGVVFQYMNNANNLQEQNPEFKNKAELFPYAIRTGNASLLLRTVTMNNEGVYRCSVTSAKVRGTVSIQLRVGAFSAPQISMSGNSLQAVAPTWLPKPGVTWSDQNGTQLNSSTTFSTNLLGIIQVMSNLSVQVTDGSNYSCVIQNNLVTSFTEATVAGNEVLTRNTFEFNSSENVIASHVMSTAVILFYMLVW